MHPLLNIAIQAAREAGKIMTRYLDRLDHISVNEKGYNDFVTEVDLQAEHVIIQTIKKSYPDHAIHAEESGVSGEHEFVWIIDPLDGTRNYLHGFPHFAVSIAIEIKGRIEHGLIYDPLRQEFFTASRGAGAFLNQKRMRVSQQHKLDQTLIATGYHPKQDPKTRKYLALIETILFEKSGSIRHTGSAALDLAYVAAGRLDGFCQSGLKPWDIAAGLLLIKEAGGLTGDAEGREISINADHVIAGNPKIFRAILQTLHPILC